MKSDDIVIVFFALLGFLGGAMLSLYFGAAPIIVAIFLSTGIAALVHRFLGGISPSTSFRIGALKLGGTIAALIGSAIVLSDTLDKQGHRACIIHRITNKDIVGRWESQYIQDSTLCRIDVQEKNGKLVFTGNVLYYKGGSWSNIWDMTDGTLEVVNNRDLQLLKCTVRDQYHRTFELQSVAPLRLGLSFNGVFRSPTTTPNMTGFQWGLDLQKTLSP